MQTRILPHSDALLLEGILHADPVQLKKLYSDHLPGIIRYISNNSGTEQDARDIFQEAVMVVYKKIQAGNLTLDVPFQSFLYAVCRNLWLAQLRYKRGKPAQEPGENLPDLDADTLSKLEKTQREQIFYHHYAALGEKCREILRAFFNKVSMKTIAKRFNTSESYIKKRKHKCKEQLIGAIQNDERFKEISQ